MNTREILALRRRMFMRRYIRFFGVPALLCMVWLAAHALLAGLTPRQAVQPESVPATAVAARCERMWHGMSVCNTGELAAHSRHALAGERAGKALHKPLHDQI